MQVDFSQNALRRSQYGDGGGKTAKEKKTSERGLEQESHGWQPCLILWRALEGKLYLRVLSTQDKGARLSYSRGIGFHILIPISHWLRAGQAWGGEGEGDGKS